MDTNYAAINQTRSGGLRSPFGRVFVWLVFMASLLVVGAYLAAPLIVLADTVWHISGRPLPTSLAIPTSDEGVPMDRSRLVSSITLVNGSGSTQTVTVQDCQVTPFVLFNAAPMAAGQTWIISYSESVRFQGCFKWAASSASVQGQASGQ